MTRFSLFLICAALALSCAIASAADSPPAEAAVPVFYLAGPKQFSEDVFPPLLVRELVRQALLIAARDELGLHTRDAVLRECDPTTDGQLPPDAFAMPALQLDVHKGPKVGQLVEQLFQLNGTQTLVSQDTIKAPEAGWGGTAIDKFLPSCELLSRQQDLDQLKALGFNAIKARYGVKPACDDPAPEGVEKRLYETTLLAPYCAVQQTHAAIYESGESPARLGALVRGYANLGQLTSFQWSTIPIALTARSLLYAQRLVIKYPDDPLSYEHRAYAYSLSGLGGAALKDLATADRMRKDAAAAGKTIPPAPDWVALIEPFCKHDIVGLSPMANPGDHRAALAALMIFIDVEYCGSVSRVMQLGDAALQVNGRCFRVIDGMMEHAGVASGHELTELAPQVMLASLPDEISRMKVVPGSVDDALRAARGNADMTANLAAVPKSFLAATEASEPSWALAGRILQETNFVHVERRAYFMSSMWGVDCSDYVQSADPLIADHPLRQYIHGMAVPPGLQADYLKDLVVKDPQYKMYNLAYAMYSLPHTWDHLSGPGIWQYIWWCHANTTGELASRLASGRYDAESNRSFAKQLLIVNPYSSLGAAVTIWLNWPDAAPHVDGWADSFRNDPLVLSDLAARYVRFRKSEKAEPLLKHLVDIAPDRFYIEQLAAFYLDQGDQDKWLATLKLALQQPEYGLDHSIVDSEIAWHFLYAGRFDLARRWADAGVDDSGGSASAMECDQAAAEYQRDFTAAEKLVRGEDERYGGIRWYQWCKRTGHGDLATAQKLADQWAAQQIQNGDQSQFWEIANLRLLEHQPGDAKQFLKTLMLEQNDAWSALQLALVCDVTKDHAGKTQALNYGIARCTTGKDGSDRSFLIAYARLVLAAGDNPPDTSDVDKILSSPDVPQKERINILYFHGRQCELAGDAKTAKAEYERAAKLYMTDAYNYILACDALHQLGEATEPPVYPATQPAQIAATTQAAPDTGAKPGWLVVAVEGDAFIYLNGKQLGKISSDSPGEVYVTLLKGDLIVVRALSKRPSREFACAFVPDKGEPYQLSMAVIPDKPPEKAAAGDFASAPPAPKGKHDWSIAEDFADAGIWNPPTTSALPDKNKWDLLGYVAP
jgi:tetratricopeptide (TPR) repeat protein